VNEGSLVAADAAEEAIDAAALYMATAAASIMWDAAPRIGSGEMMVERFEEFIADMEHIYTSGILWNDGMIGWI